jgi:stearoyl-CoA desaturase (delta-9 desaturase)
MLALWSHGPSLLWLGIPLGLIYSWLGANLAAHRWLTHGHITVQHTVTKLWLHWVLTMNLIGSGVVYANVHWQHHQHTDDIHNDPHTPLRNGAIWTYLRENGDYKFRFNLRLFRRMMADPCNAFFHDWYWAVHAVSVALLFVLGGTWLVVAAWAIPAVICYHLAQFQAVITHTRLPGATQNFGGLAQHSYNIWWLKPLLFGEELHNNHHGLPANPNGQHQHTWREWDPLFSLVIKPFFVYRQRNS